MHSRTGGLYRRNRGDAHDRATIAPHGTQTPYYSFHYRIEPKPEGGFLAHASDPAAAPLEASTREELQQKIQANIATTLASDFPSMKLPLENSNLKLAFHIEHKPGGGFVIHSANPDAKRLDNADLIIDACSRHR